MHQLTPPNVYETGSSLFRPLCAYPKQAHCKGQGDAQDANDFERLWRNLLRYRQFD